MTDEKFILLVVGDLQQRQLRLFDLLREKYGDRLEIINQCEFEEIQDKDIDFMIIDEIVQVVPESIVVEKSFKLRGREYWQKGRWG
jgi:hypothetical protein